MIDVFEPRADCTVIYIAARIGAVEMLGLLVRLGADVNAEVRLGEHQTTVIHAVVGDYVEGNNVEAFFKLASLGADLVL